MVDHEIGKIFKPARLNRSPVSHLQAVILSLELKNKKQKNVGRFIALLKLFVTEENCKILCKENFQKKIKS